MTSGRPIVMDASIALALVLDEPIRPLIERWIRSLGDRRIVVPSHFWLEVLNRVTRDGTGTDADRSLAAIHQLDRLRIESIELTRPMLLQVLDRVERHRLTAYDAVYLVVAESLDADLATLDRPLAGAAGARAVTFDDEHRLHETPTVYEHDVTWPRYKEASAYLAKLRAEALAGRTG
jgi:predicted nucleic acid-binding protein